MIKLIKRRLGISDKWKPSILTFVNTLRVSTTSMSFSKRASTTTHPMVKKWLELRSDPVKHDLNRIAIMQFIRKASFEEENAYYEQLHREYMK